MKAAGCNVGQRGHVRLERPGAGGGPLHASNGWTGCLDRLAAERSFRAILATPSGGRPAWMSQRYPEVLRVDADRRRNLHGLRHNHCFTSPVYREKSRGHQPAAGRALRPTRPSSSGTCPTSTAANATASSARRPSARGSQRRYGGAWTSSTAAWWSGLLEPHLHRLGADRVAGSPRGAAPAGPEPGLEAVRDRPDHRLHAGRDRPAARAHPRGARHDEPDGHLSGPELLEARPAPGRGQLEQLPRLARERGRCSTTGFPWDPRAGTGAPRPRRPSSTT